MKQMLLRIVTGQHRLPTADLSCFRHVALLERFDLAHFYLQDILTSQNVRSERTRSEIFRKDERLLAFKQLSSAV